MRLLSTYSTILKMFFPFWGVRGTFCLLLIVYCQLATAQLFPVQANPQLVPPYSLKLSDYATTTSEKLLLNLLLTDVNEADLQVRLRFSIDGGSIDVRSTNFVQDAAPIRLTGGVPLRLSNLDLRPYFNLGNLEGITPRQYNTPLPDGLYQFCFQVFDWVTGLPLSQKRCVPVYLILNDPPFLNLPQRGEQVMARNPQNIIFQWTPRHLNATGVQYRFELRELWDDQIDPQAGFLASPDLYNTVTFATTLLYGPGETGLLEGKTYGWRVRAVVGNGISETSVFKNNGYSEIFHFTYTGQCDAPQFILAKSQGTTTEEISWLPDPKHLQSQVQYRKVRSGSRAESRLWFEQETVENTKKLYFLEPGTAYEFRVGGRCVPNGGYSFSQIHTFTTPTREEASTYNCGIAPEIRITNRDPLTQLGINDIFTAGDFSVTIKEVVGANGTFSGWGFIVVPYLADTQLRVGFNNIQINTDKQLIGGVVETAYDPDFATAQGNEGIDDIQDELEAIGDVINGILETFTGTEQEISLLEEVNQKQQEYIDGLLSSEYISQEIKNGVKNNQTIYESASSTLIVEATQNGPNPDGYGMADQIIDTNEELQKSIAIAEDQVFIGEAYEILGNDPIFEKTFEELRKIVEYLKETKELCEKEGWASFENKGVVPYCIWKNAPINEGFYYSKVDIPYVSGMIDGAYQEVEGLVQLPKMLYQLGNGINDFIFAYTAAYLACHPKITELNEKRLGELIRKLEESKKENGVWEWLKEQWYSIEGYKASYQKKLCDDAEKMRKEVNELVEYLSELENIKKLYFSVEKKIIAYFEVLSSSDNRSRYEHGKIVVFVGSGFIPFAGQLSKISRVKKVLQAMQKFTKGQWDEFFRKVDERLGRGFNNVGRVFKVGDDIAGFAIKKVRKGSNGKIAVIGRSMGNSKTRGVKDIYQKLLQNGDKVEIFDVISLKGEWSDRFDDAMIEFERMTNTWTKRLSNQELLQLDMYKLNKEWAEMLKKEGYTVIDMGDFNNQGFSAFYAMEKNVIFK